MTGSTHTHRSGGDGRPTRPGAEAPASTPQLPPPDATGLNVHAPSAIHRSTFASVVVSSGISCAVGAVAGFVWGGIGGRVAMRIVFLTSSEHVRGLTSDDGFEIGVISGATIFLLVFTTVLGAMGGTVVGLLRTVTAGPTWAVAGGTSITAATWVGAIIVHPDGVDFRFLGPLWLTVGLFVLIPALWGATVVVASDLLVRSFRLHGPSLPSRHRSIGAIGWIVLAVAAAVGVQGLVTDIADLV